jgi:hypothetical protein
MLDVVGVYQCSVQSILATRTPSYEIRWNSTNSLKQCGDIFALLSAVVFCGRWIPLTALVSASVVNNRSIVVG